MNEPLNTGDLPSDFTDIISDPSLAPNMTVIIGLAAKDGCVLIGDRLAIDWANTTQQENVQKLFPIGKNVAIGLANEGEKTRHFLDSCHYINAPECFEPRHRANQVANVLRKAFLGKTLSPGWWEEEEDRIQHLGKQWNKSPRMGAIVAGFDKNGPALMSMDQNAAFVAQNALPAFSIGVTYWSMPLLQHFYPGQAQDHDIEEAIRIGIFCAHLTSRMSRFVGGNFDVAIVTAEEVSLCPEDEVTEALCCAEKTFTKWTEDVLGNSEAQDRRRSHHADD